MFKTLINILKIELKYAFNSKFAFIGYSLGIFVNLLVYYFTSKALVPQNDSNVNLLKYGYFEYIVIGEIVLLLTQASLTQGQDLLIRLRNNGLLEQIYYSKIGVIRSLLLFYIALTFINSIHVLITIILSKIFFSLSLSLVIILKFMLLMFLVSFIFIGIYLLNIFITMVLKKRNNSLQHVVNLMGFFSGAYFPLEVIGNKKFITIMSASPLTALIGWTRGVIYENIWFSSNLNVLIAWMLIPLALGILIYYSYIKKRLGFFYVNQ